MNAFERLMEYVKNWPCSWRAEMNFYPDGSMCLVAYDKDVEVSKRIAGVDCEIDDEVDIFISQTKPLVFQLEWDEVATGVWVAGDDFVIVQHHRGFLYQVSDRVAGLSAMDIYTLTEAKQWCQEQARASEPKN